MTQAMNQPEKLPEDLHERSALGFGRNLVAGKPATMSVNYYFDGKYFIDPGTQKKCGALYGAKIEGGVLNYKEDTACYCIVMDSNDHRGAYADLNCVKRNMVGLMNDRLYDSLRDQYGNGRVDIEWVSWDDFNPTDLLHHPTVYNNTLNKVCRALKSWTMEEAASERFGSVMEDLRKCLVFDIHLEGIEIPDKALKKLTQRKFQEWDVERAFRFANALSIMSSPEKVKENRTHLV